MTYLYFLQRKVISNVMYAPGQVGEFTTAQATLTDLAVAQGSARAATTDERDAFLADQAALAEDHGRKGSLPSGGTTAQKLVKASDDDFDAEWADDTGGAITGADVTTALGYTPENQANKSTNVATDAASDVKYPSAKAVNTAIQSAVVGLWDDRGNFNASVNTFPTTGGSGSAGAILKGDIWTISVIAVSGPLLGYPVGSTVRALTDTPGQTAGNWDVLNVGIGYVAENSANKSTDIAADTGSNTKYPSVAAVETAIEGAISLTLQILASVSFSDDTVHDVLTVPVGKEAVVTDFIFYECGGGNDLEVYWDNTGSSSHFIIQTGNFIYCQPGFVNTAIRQNQVDGMLLGDPGNGNIFWPVGAAEQVLKAHRTDGGGNYRFLVVGFYVDSTTKLPV
jgi:hypothetical protein